jgi:HAD superfamily hydrolase (TIGR01509 family)
VPNRHISALTFDGDGTLWNFEQAKLGALQKTADLFANALAGKVANSVSGRWLQEIRDEIASDPRNRTLTVEELRYQSFVEAAKRCGSLEPAFPRLAFECYMKSRSDHLELFPDAVPALTQLCELYPIALITNGNMYSARLEISAFFREIVTAREAGFYKPDPRLYTYTARRLGVASADCIHIGDHPTEDISASREAGFRAIWLNRTQAAWPPSTAPADSIVTLLELPAVLASRS